jgi:hypothetical protein
VHLLAAPGQRCGVVPGQVRVDGTTSEITRFAPLLEPLDLAGYVITAGALHTQRQHVGFLVTGKGPITSRWRGRTSRACTPR